MGAENRRGHQQHLVVIHAKTPQAGDDLGRFLLSYMSIFSVSIHSLTHRGDIGATHLQSYISTHAPSMTERHEVAYHFNFMFQPAP